MATVFGVEPDPQISRLSKGKRVAGASPEQPLVDWNQKKSKQMEIRHTSSNEIVNQRNFDVEAVVHLGLTVDTLNDGTQRDVVDPFQPPTSR